MKLYFPPGDAESRPLPLDRFIPPLNAGAAAALLHEQGIQQRVVLDAFGSNPRLPLEAAASGCAVLVSCTNPILRFLLQYTGKPFRQETLRTALARIATLPKDSERLENYLRSLYRSRCEHCGSEVEVDEFLWVYPKDVPSYKVYRCGHCNFVGETAAGIEDARWMRELTEYRQHQEMMLARIAPPGDPYRQHAAEALEMYTPRARIALGILINKLDQLQLDPLLQDAVRALYLTTMDRCSSLWSYPFSSRPRPKQLSLSPRYYEYNVWQALVWSVERWTVSDPGVEVVPWQPGMILQPGTVHVFAGSVRDLQQHLARETPLRMVSVMPRPNQAFWSLSVLWTVWLFGREEAEPIKRSLLRRRYDWHWFAGAMKSTLSGLGKVLARTEPALALLLEAEPAYLAAVNAGFSTAGFFAGECALHEDSGQALCTWYQSPPGETHHSGTEADGLIRLLSDVLLARAEPASYSLLAAAGQSWLTGTADSMLGAQAGQLMDSLNRKLAAVLADRRIFLRLDQNVELERALFWLSDGNPAVHPLSDRVERLVLDMFSNNPVIPGDELLDRVYREFPAALLPSEKFIRLCAESYAVAVGGAWHLRDEEHPSSRTEDCEEIMGQLWSLGQRLGFQVDDMGDIIWLDEQFNKEMVFRISTRAEMGFLLDHRGEGNACLIVPGSRSALILDRLRRDPRLKQALDQGTRILKFRQIRRLALDPAVQRSNYHSYLDLDPLEHQDPQIRLL